MSSVDTAPELSRWSRASDWLNPILVRELQQAVKGRAFSLSVLAALVVMVVIAVVAVQDGESSRTAGRDVFSAGLATLAPLLLFVVPMQAYNGMRTELRAGIAEQLLLSELRPFRIVAGKLLAAMVQFVLYVAVLAPLLATSYLLRGVDLPSIAISLAFALLCSLTATAVALSAAAQGALPGMQGLANLGVAVGLGFATFGCIGYIGSSEYLRDLGWLLRSNESVAVFSLLLLLSLAAIVLSILVAQSFLAHAFENRSTGFRVYLLVALALAVGWVTLALPGPLDRQVPGLAVILSLLGAGFGLFMVTEQKSMSVRVQAHVPKNPWLAFVASPFLPGRDRGAQCILLYFGILLLLLHQYWPTTVAATPRWTAILWRSALVAIAYVMIYLGIARGLRHLMPAAVVGNHLARFATPMVLLAGCILPFIFDVAVVEGRRGWHPGHVLNPFYTMVGPATAGSANAAEDERYALPLLLGGLAGALLVISAVRGWREVFAAAAARRRATVAVPAAAVEAQNHG